MAFDFVKESILAVFLVCPCFFHWSLQVSLDPFHSVRSRKGAAGTLHFEDQIKTLCSGGENDATPNVQVCSVFAGKQKEKAEDLLKGSVERKKGD